MKEEKRMNKLSAEDRAELKLALETMLNEIEDRFNAGEVLSKNEVGLRSHFNELDCIELDKNGVSECIGLRECRNIYYNASSLEEALDQMYLSPIVQEYYQESKQLTALIKSKDIYMDIIEKYKHE